MDLATLAMKELRRRGKLDDLDALLKSMPAASRWL
jgi:hypothetical protein